MSKQTPKLQWQMCEDETQWRAAKADAPPSIAVHRTGRSLRRWRWVLAVLLAVLLPASVAGYQQIRDAEQAIDRVEDDVRAAVAADAWVDQHSAKIVESTVEMQSAPKLEAHMLGLEARRVEVRGDYAMVEVWTAESAKPWLPAPYRQTRFYRETVQGWQRVEPPDLFWQPVDTLQVGRFTFVYGARDAEAVLEAARQVEQMDAGLRAELGLPVADEALVVKVMQNLRPSRDPEELMRMFTDVALYAPSPALLALPAPISEGDALLQLITGLLTKRALDEALGNPAHFCVWQLLANGLYPALLWEHSELPSPMRYETDRDFQVWLIANPHPELAWFGTSSAACSPSVLRGIEATGLIDRGAAVSIVEYAMTVYGRDRLPALIDGMRRYDTWETLIPAVFGVSAAEFEAGWQDWLTAGMEHMDK